MSKKMKVAFDLGNKSVKVAAVKKGVLELHELPLPEHLVEDDTVTMPHAFSAFLKKAKKELRLPGGPAGLLLPPSQVICRLVTMPRMSVDQLMLNLPYEFNDFIHGEPHQYYCDYALCQTPEEIGEEGEEPPLTMMAAAAQRQQIQDYIRMFAAGGFSLKRILPQEMALIQLVQAYRRVQPTAPEEFCFIDLGYLSTRIFIIHGDRIQTTRRIPIGCRELDSVVADIFHVDQFLSDQYKRSNYQGILEHPRCMDVYEQIGVEALKLINFYHFTYRQNQLEGVYFIGGGASIEPLRRVLSESLGLTSYPVSELLSAAQSQTQEPCAFACAAGLIAENGEEG